MNCNLLLLSCLLFAATAAHAQKKTDLSQLTIPGSAALRPVENNVPQAKFDYKQMNAPLPKFVIFNHEQKDITKDVTESGGNLIVMMFNPTCGHCEDETLLMEQHIELFKKSKILLVAAPVQTPNLPYFESNVKFSQYTPKITVAVDSAKLIEKIFNYVELPQINIYDGKTHRLLKTFNGLQPLDSLKAYIQ